jgi:hypothetical protein
MPVPNNDQWNQVVVPLKEFRYAFSQNGKGDGKLDTSKLRLFGIAAYQKPPFSFKIDCVEFVKLGRTPTLPPRPRRKMFSRPTPALKSVRVRGVRTEPWTPLQRWLAIRVYDAPVQGNPVRPVRSSRIVLIRFPFTPKLPNRQRYALPCGWGTHVWSIPSCR